MKKCGGCFNPRHMTQRSAEIKETGSMGVAVQHLAVAIPVESIDLEGDLSVPTAARGVVLFAHGSGSSRRSPRNRYVADLLNEGGLATLLIDLLTEDEQQVDLQTAQLRFDIPFLAKRLVIISQWLAQHPDVAGLNIGLFGASTGAGAALVAAAELPHLILAVVSRGGRPDLAGQALANVEAPTLLIVGGADPVVLDLNQTALGLMRCEKALKVVPGASHLFEEPGALDKVAEMARNWFLEKLR
jgi:putative phosphoribosyl transferase